MDSKVETPAHFQFHYPRCALLLQTLHGLHECLGLPVDEAHVLDDLVLRVEQLDALRVRVVARSERPFVRSSELPGKFSQSIGWVGNSVLHLCPRYRFERLRDYATGRARGITQPFKTISQT